MTLQPVVLSPATPLEVLNYVTRKCHFPTTLLIGGSQSQFLESLVEEFRSEDLHKDGDQGEDHIDEHQAHDGDRSEQKPPPPRISTQQHPLLKATLGQIAVSRHIRLAFVPTLTHLRAYLTAFSTADSALELPPSSLPVIKPSEGRGSGSGSDSPAPLLIIYGLVELHRYSSEWSAQGLGESVAAFVEAASRESLRAVLIEPRQPPAVMSVDKTGDGDGNTLGSLLDEALPLLSSSVLHQNTAWNGRMVTLRTVLERWFRIQPQSWTGA